MYQTLLRILAKDTGLSPNEIHCFGKTKKHRKRIPSSNNRFTGCAFSETNQRQYLHVFVTPNGYQGIAWDTKEYL